MEVKEIMSFEVNEVSEKVIYNLREQLAKNSISSWIKYIELEPFGFDVFTSSGDFTPIMLGDKIYFLTIEYKGEQIDVIATPFFDLPFDILDFIDGREVSDVERKHISNEIRNFYNTHKVYSDTTGHYVKDTLYKLF